MQPDCTKIDMAHGIAEFKDLLSGTVGKFLAPDALKKRTQKHGHDIYHVGDCAAVASLGFSRRFPCCDCLRF